MASVRPLSSTEITNPDLYRLGIAGPQSLPGTWMCQQRPVSGTPRRCCREHQSSRGFGRGDIDVGIQRD